VGVLGSGAKYDAYALRFRDGKVDIFLLIEYPFGLPLNSSPRSSTSIRQEGIQKEGSYG
jgi:hypothetical protein